MSKMRFNLNSLKPYFDNVGPKALQFAKDTGNLLKDKEFQKSMAKILIPSGLSALYFKRKYQKAAEEKEALYKQKLAEHNAIIEELTTATEISKERQDTLLQFDSKLKLDINSLESEIKELRDKLAEYEKERENE